MDNENKGKGVRHKTRKTEGNEVKKEQCERA
jgi:hypothetical protein